MVLLTKVVSSLEKIFSYSEPKEYIPTSAPTVLKGEIYSFQIAYTCDEIKEPWLKIEIVSDIKDFIELKRVGLAPADYSAPINSDDNYLLKTPALIPDILYPLGSKTFRCVPKYWQSLWIEINTKTDIKEGIYPINFLFKDKNDNSVGKQTFSIEILNINLPKQELILTQWFHSDCISSYYNLNIMSKEHWDMIEKFLINAHNHGMNMILTPLFTLPLDTEIGGERPTFQLVDVTKTGDKYSFNFDKLKHWIDLCSSIGYEYFEMSHLFTQWGAYATPKIMATVDNEYKKIFGWEVSASDISYKNFLDSFLPALVNFIHEQKIADRCYFHISDEPYKDTEESYSYAKSLVAPHLKGFKIIDALSEFVYYEKGLVENPIPANDHIAPFIEAKVPNLWTYYCCSQAKDVSNRFMSMPSARNRIIATQLFKFDIKGFLHWAYNFYYSQFSKELINPFRVTDAGLAFPAGDPFLVYPGEDGPIDSIRLKVFTEALYDLRAMQLLAKLTSKEHVLELIEKDLNNPITFKNYPCDADYILELRQTINKDIKENI